MYLGDAMCLRKSVCKVCILHDCLLGQRQTKQLSSTCNQCATCRRGPLKGNERKNAYICLALLLHCNYIVITHVLPHKFPTVVTLYTLPSLGTLPLRPADRSSLRLRSSNLTPCPRQQAPRKPIKHPSCHRDGLR